MTTDASNNVTLVAGANVASAQIIGSGTPSTATLRVTFASAMASASYGVWPSSNGHVVVGHTSKTTTTVDLTLASGFGNQAGTWNVLVFGAQ
jgi:hypothetical protein